MDGDIQGALLGAPERPGYYVWRPEDTPVAIHLRLDVVDRLAAEIMRGYGAVPKRGAEIGGLLIGQVEPGEIPVVRIEDFEPVACDYKRGPSYLFGGEDGAAFEQACSRWKPEGGGDEAVGFFRSHTREGLGLSAEDVELMDRYFSAPDRVVLLVKPFATRVSAAGFFVRQNGSFPEQSPLEFPLSRRDLGGGPPPSRSRVWSTRGRPAELPAPEREPLPLAEPEPRPAGKRARSGWVWIPLSFIFLLVGVLLGIQSALTMAPKVTGAKPEDFTLSLSVARADGNLTVKWNREAPVIKEASRGVLEIEDGGFAKPVDLDASHLKSGSIIYRNSSDHVRFRLSVYLAARVTVTETLDWKQ
jgi:hypothetical protein